MQQPMRIDPFAVFDRFSDEWLVTSWASRLFLLAVPFVLAVTPVFFGWVNIRKPTPVTQVLGGTVGVVGPIALFFLWFGMWRYWVRFDTSGSRSRKVWFVILLVGLWCGSVLYYLLVYRPQISSRADGAHKHIV